MKRSAPIPRRVRVFGPVACALALASATSALPAFPGAEGFGADTPGGRGGAILFVTNLDDAGPGSLRAAVETPGPRIVIFRVSGDIVLQSALVIDEPFLTIAGQTAPAGGIRIRNDPAGSLAADSFPPVRIRTNDVVIRYLRLRPGMLDFDPQCADIDPPSCFNDGNPPANPNPAWTTVCAQSPPPCQDPGDIDGISIEEGSAGVVIDHVSISWHSDEGVALVRAQDVTLQSSFVAEGLHYYHYDPVPNSFDGKGMLVGDKAAQLAGIVTGRISVHHNLFAHNAARDPAMGNYCFDPPSPADCVADVVNNSAYNWANFGLNTNNFLGHHYLNAVSNYYKDGPDRKTGSGPNGQTLNDWRGNPDSPMNTGDLEIHFAGNRTETTSGQITDPPILCSVWQGTSFAPCDAADYLVPRFDTPEISTATAEDAHAQALQDAGASARIDAEGRWVPARDATDLRIIAEVSAVPGTGSIIQDHTEFLARAYPLLSTGPPPLDSDGDGLPDAWETRFGFDPLTANAPTADTDGDGYLDVEEYFNGTSPLPTASSVPGLLGWGSGVALALLACVGVTWRRRRSSQG